jgi:hypothetical protein|tara:strand:+ start:445 stop:702 length:258 start_codon:yes stop_codon:yes gene_type:complete
MRFFQVSICVFILTYFVLLLNLPPLWSAIGYTLMSGVTYHNAATVIERHRITKSPTETTVFSLFFGATWPVFYFISLCFFIAGDR